MISKLLTIGAYAAALVAIAAGVLCFSNVPTQLGFYKWMATKNPTVVGLTPAYMHGTEWNYNFEELLKENVSGQTAIVTGANAGIGYEISLALGRLGAHVTMVCRNPTKCGKAADRIRADTDFKGSTVASMTMDTSSLASVKAFAEAYTKVHPHQALDMLFLNAGGVFNDVTQKCVPLSEDGIELTFASNYVGHHLLYQWLEPALRRSKLARVVQTSSCASFDPYTYKVATDLETLNGCSEPFTKGVQNLSYGQSKLAQILWTKAVTRRLGPESNIYVNAFHPGMVNTEIWDKALAKAPGPVTKFFDWLRSEVMWGSAEGALTGLYLGVAVNRLVEEQIRGKYYHPQSQEVVNEMALNVALQDDLWNFSESLVRGFLDTNASSEA